MRILWSSNAPWTPSGYGQQTALMTPRIKAMGHEVAIFGWWGLVGSAMLWDYGIPVYPKLFDRYGNDALAAHAEHFKAELIITLMDVAAMHPRAVFDTPWIPWWPVDCEPVRVREVGTLRKALTVVALSRFGEEQAKRVGLLDVRVIPHGIDTTVFSPGDQVEARERLGFPQDRFIVGMVGANKGKPCRKAFLEHILAFAELHEKYPDSLLYLHTHRSSEMEGLDLPAICQSVGLEVRRDVIFVGLYANVAGLIPPEQMVDVYRSMDVLANASYGEGFGIPILEAQACGIPVITGDWTAMPEITFAGWPIDKCDAERTLTNFNTWQWRPRVGAIRDAMEDAYHGRFWKGTREDARAGALKFDVDLLAETRWKPLLEEVGEWVAPGAGGIEMVKFS